MPVIDLPVEPPLPGANTFFYPIFAVMLYPKDERRRERWFAATMAACYSMWRQEGAGEEVLSDFHGWIGILWELPQAPRRVYEDGMARVPRASLSGYQLRYLLSLALHHPEHCKVERVKALVREFHQPEGEAVSESLLEKVWPDFKAVSHLWAAFRDLNERGEDQGEHIYENAYWLRVLGLAEAYRLAAEGRRLLKPAETWKAPADRGVEVPPIDPQPLSAEKLLFLQREFPA